MSTATDAAADSAENLGEAALTKARELIERDPLGVMHALEYAEDEIEAEEKQKQREQYRIGRQHDVDRRKPGVWAEAYVLPDGSRPIIAVDDEGVLRGVYFALDPEQAGNAVGRLQRLVDTARDRFDVAEIYPPWARREAPEVDNGDREEMEE